jgi:hypothetical protein
VCYRHESSLGILSAPIMPPVCFLISSLNGGGGIGQFFGHLVNVFCGHLVYFLRFGMLPIEKYGNPYLGTQFRDWLMIHLFS